MKKTFFILTLILSSSVHANNCSILDPLGLIPMLRDLTKDPCKDKLSSELASQPMNDEYCGCLVSSKGVILDALKSSSAANNKDLAKLAKDEAEKRKTRLDRLYRYLNYEVGLQEQKYDLVDKNKQVGCTPKDMASTMDAAFCTAEGCPDEYGNIHQADGQKANSVLDGASSRNIANNIQKRRNDGAALLDLSKEKLDKVIESFLRNSSLSDRDKERIRIIQASTKANKDKLAETEVVRHEVNQRIANERKAQQILNNITKAPFVKSVYEVAYNSSFKEVDEKVAKQFESDNKISIAGSCINYDDYKVMASIPKPEMMDSWVNSSPEKIADSFLAGNVKTNKEVQKFLFRNPVLAKSLISKEQREKLAKSLYNFANLNRNTPPELMPAKYAAFMSSDVRKLNDDNKMGSLLQCDLLAQNYAAASDPQMSLALLNTEENNDLSKLANNVQVCQVQQDNKKQNKESKATLDEIVNANELFAIFNSETKENIFSPAGDEDYLTFIDQNCDKAEIEKITKKRSGGLFNCIGQSKETCEEKARNNESGLRERVLAEYYKKHPQLGAMVKSVRTTTKSTNYDHLANKSNENKQDQTVRTAYEKYVKPAVMRRSMYDVSNAMGVPASGAGSDQSSIADAVNKAQESYTSSHSASQVADSGHSSEAAVAGSASSDQSNASDATAAGSSVNPGQYIPPFLEAPKAAPVSSRKIASVQDAKDALDDMEDASADEKDELAGKAKEYLSAQDQTSKDIADLQKKLSEYEQEKQVAPAAAVADNTRVAARAPASVNLNVPTSVNKASASASFGPASSASSSSGSAKLSSSSTVSKAAASYANALNQANESRTDAKSLSLVVESGAAFDFNNSPVASSGNLVIGTSLEPSDKLFAEISSDPDAMKAYLAQNLKEVPVDKVVSIKCKGAGCNANSSEILLVITKGSDNKFSIRSVSRDTKVARSHRIMDLKNELDRATR